jgi:hypothetical protein
MVGKGSLKSTPGGKSAMRSWKISFMKWVLTSALLVLCVSTMAQQTSRVADCSTLKYKRHRSASLCGSVSVCSGDLCGGLSTYGFDDGFDVVLRDNHGKELETKHLSDESPTFCFDGHANGDYQLAFVLYKSHVPEPARVFPTRYKHSREEPHDAYFMIEETCPSGRQ